MDKIRLTGKIKGYTNSNNKFIPLFDEYNAEIQLEPVSDEERKDLGISDEVLIKMRYECVRGSRDLSNIVAILPKKEEKKHELEELRGMYIDADEKQLHRLACRFEKLIDYLIKKD